MEIGDGNVDSEGCFFGFIRRFESDGSYNG